MGRLVITDSHDVLGLTHGFRTLSRAMRIHLGPARLRPPERARSFEVVRDENVLIPVPDQRTAGESSASSAL